MNYEKNIVETLCKMRPIGLPHHDMGVPARLSVVSTPSDPLPVKSEIFRDPDDGQGGAAKLGGPELLVKTSS